MPGRTEDEDEMTTTILPESQLRMLLMELNTADGRSTWSVPISPGGALPNLVRQCRRLAQEGKDIDSQTCQAFYENSLRICYVRVLTESAVQTWESSLLNFIYKACMDFIDLFAVKIGGTPCPAHWEVMALILSPMSRFHEVTLNHMPVRLSVERQYARAGRKGYIVDLLNHFGAQKCFDLVLARFRSERNRLTMQTLCQYAKLFCACAPSVTGEVLKEYLCQPLEACILQLEQFCDMGEMKNFCRSDTSAELLGVTIKHLKSACDRVVPGAVGFWEDLKLVVEKVQLLYFGAILEVAPFNSKMSVLKEINSMHSEPPKDDDHLTPNASRLLNWIKDTDVVSVVLRDNLHHKSYVEKVESLFLFICSTGNLTNDHLTALWMSQIGKHDAIAHNIHNLIGRIAWRCRPEQLDHLFSLFEMTASSMDNKKAQENLLSLLCRLVEEDRAGEMTTKVLNVQWSLAFDDKTPPDIVEQALAGQVKVLKSVPSKDALQAKTNWISKCYDQLQQETWVLQSLHLMLEILRTIPNSSRGRHQNDRERVLQTLVSDQEVLSVLQRTMRRYIRRVKRNLPENPSGIIRSTFKPDGKTLYADIISKCLEFMKFVVREGCIYLEKDHVEAVWSCLARESPFVEDFEVCLQWLFLLLGKHPDITSEDACYLLMKYIIRLDPSAFSESGFRCVERMFQVSNKLWPGQSPDRSGVREPGKFHGWDYLWEVVLRGKDAVALHAMSVQTGCVLHGKELGCTRPVVDIHRHFLLECTNKFQNASQKLFGDNSLGVSDTPQAAAPALTNRLTDTHCKRNCIRICHLLTQFVASLDKEFRYPRSAMPHSLCSRGEDLPVIVNFQHGLVAGGEPRAYTFHTGSTFGSVRVLIQEIMKKRQISRAPVLRLDRTSTVDAAQDYRLLSSFGRSKLMVTVSAGSRDVKADAADYESPASNSPVNTDMDVVPRDNGEEHLPGVILSKQSSFMALLLNILDSTSTNNMPDLAKSIRSLILTMPTNPDRVNELKAILNMHRNATDHERCAWNNGISPALYSRLIDATPAQILYDLEIMHGMMIPADGAGVSFQVDFLRLGGLSCIAALLQGEGAFDDSSPLLKRSAHRVLLRLSKLFFAAVGQARVGVVLTVVQEASTLSTSGSPVVDLSSPDLGRLVEESDVSRDEYEDTCRLQIALTKVPTPEYDHWVRSMSVDLSKMDPMTLKGCQPSPRLINCVRKITLNAGVHKDRHGAQQDSTVKVHASVNEFPSTASCTEAEYEDDVVAREGIQLLSVMAALAPSTVAEQITDSLDWVTFFSSMLLSASSEIVRRSANEAFFNIFACCLAERSTLKYVITKLFELLPVLSETHTATFSNFFDFFCRLLEYGGLEALDEPQRHLAVVIEWLDHTRMMVRSGKATEVCDSLLIGYLGVLKCLVFMLSPEEKYQVGLREGGCRLIKKLLGHFLFPSSTLHLEGPSGGRRECRQRYHLPQVVCCSPGSQAAAYGVLLELCSSCMRNTVFVCTELGGLFYKRTDVNHIQDWDYHPNLPLREPGLPTGLRNGGATCYLNSVVQVLNSVGAIRDTVLSAHNVGWEKGDNRHTEYESPIGRPPSPQSNGAAGPSAIVHRSCRDDDEPVEDAAASSTASTPFSHEEKRHYHANVLRQLQHTFAHMSGATMQSHEPEGLWTTVRINNEKLVVREQYDALEFMNSLTDSVDQALCQNGHPKICDDMMRGSYADQKICQDCPHRYSRQEAFSSIALDITNRNGLLESFAEYVKGDLLEGDNRYHCEKCDCKRDAVKRLTIDELPKILVCQLKRFSYDWEHELTIKSNDYYEFPRSFDIWDFTAQGLATAEDKDGDSSSKDCKPTDQSTMYSLCAVIVHSGQATSGHYYCFIKRKLKNGCEKWFKYDDQDVTEHDMTDKEFKDQFFGGEISDSAGRGNGYRRAKKGYSAYLLCYERLDAAAMTSPMPASKLPSPIAHIVQCNNLMYAHERSHFNPEYFRFLSGLLESAAALPKQAPQMELAQREEYMLEVLQLTAKFWFRIGMRCHAKLRGAAEHWFSNITALFANSRSCRSWFTTELLLRNTEYFYTCLLDSPHPDIRVFFSIMLAKLCEFSMDDRAVALPLVDKDSTSPNNYSYWQELKKQIGGEEKPVLVYIVKMLCMLGPRLLNVSIIHPTLAVQFLQFFLSYGGLGNVQVYQLARLDCHMLLLQILTCDRLQLSADLMSVHSLVANMLLTYRVSGAQLGNHAGSRIDPAIMVNPADNPYQADQHADFLPDELRALYISDFYLDRLLQEAIPFNPNIQTLWMKLSWQCPTASHCFLRSSLMAANRMAYTMRIPYLNILMGLMSIQDSWQSLRVRMVMFGGDNKEGYLEYFRKTQSVDFKKGSQLALCALFLLQRCPVIVPIVLEQDVKQDCLTKMVRFMKHHMPLVRHLRTCGITDEVDAATLKFAEDLLQRNPAASETEGEEEEEDDDNDDEEEEGEEELEDEEDDEEEENIEDGENADDEDDCDEDGDNEEETEEDGDNEEDTEEDGDESSGTEDDATEMDIACQLVVDRRPGNGSLAIPPIDEDSCEVATVLPMTVPASVVSPDSTDTSESGRSPRTN